MSALNIGFINSCYNCATTDQNSLYGFRNYDINQNSFFSNVVYNSIITNTQNKIKLGLNYTSDVYDEILNRLDVGRKDNSYGGFFENSFDNFYRPIGIKHLLIFGINIGNFSALSIGGFDNESI